MLNDLPKINYSNSYDALKVALAANTSILLIGDPGVGKSAIMQALSRDVDMPLHTLIGSTLDPTDVGGLPVLVNGRAERQPLACIYDAAQRPCILFLDELSAAPLPVQAAFLRLILERVAGDVTLHPETRVVAAANPPEQAPGGFDLSAPLMGRLCVLHFRPDEDEVMSYFMTMGDEEKEPELRDEARTFAALAGVVPDLLQVDIPKDCVTGGRPWGAPRAWERVVRSRAAARRLGGISKEADQAMMAGSVGRHCATAYRAVLDMINDLPSVDEIVKAPKTAKIPEDPHKQVAAVGLIGRVAEKNLWAAYIYTVRLRPEYAMAANKVLMTMQHKAPITDPLAKEGVEARVKLVSGVKRFK